MKCFTVRSVLPILCYFVYREPAVSGVITNELFSFGTANDTELPRGDDEVASEPFLNSFLFYGKSYSSFGISYNDIILILFMANIP